MRKVRLLFWHTYWGSITHRSYLIFTFGLPFFILVIPVILSLVLGFFLLMAQPPTDSRPLGVVDQSGRFSDAEPVTGGPVIMWSFAAESEAAVALRSGEIQAYYTIPADYWNRGQVTLTYDVAPSQEVRAMFSRWVRDRVEAEVAPAILERYRQGAYITHQGVAETADTFAPASRQEWIIVYVLIYFVRNAGLFTSGYMYDSIASEARNRTIEILLTTLSPLQFVVGKFLGLLLVGLTQLMVWGTGLLLIGWLAAARLGLDVIDIVFGWEHLAVVLSMLLGAYLLDQIMAAAAGMLRVSGGAGPQLFNLVGMVVGLALLYAAYFVPRNPNAWPAVATSLFPLTASIVMPVRVVAGQVPAWQIALSQGLLTATILAGFFLLRALLQRNLVSYADRFHLRRWFRERIS